MLKTVLFRLHWILGIAAGLVLAVVGGTGAILGFEDPILSALNPQWDIAQNGRAALPPDAWLAAARAANPGAAVRSLGWSGDDAAVTVRVARGKDRGVEVAVDPYTGVVLGAERGSAFFATVEQLHRNLAAGPVGKQIVGFSTAMLLVLLVSGVYLRWPRNVRSLRAWFVLDMRLKGRGFLRQLHAIAGTLVLPLYLVAALTGLWWSYDVYRDAVNRMAGVSAPVRRPRPADDANAVPLSIDIAWKTFRHEIPQATQANLNLASAAEAPLEVRYLLPDSPHPRAFGTLKIDATSGAVVEREDHAALPTGRRFVATIFPLHTGSYFGWSGRILMAFAALLLPVFTITGLWLWLLRRRHAALRHARPTAMPAQREGRDAVGGASRG